MFVIGIDTSNYRTSLCLIDRQYQVIAEANPLLNVAQGALGLQQSQAVFAHLKQWPLLLDQLGLRDKVLKEIKAVGVSVAPRPVEGSYMPVFKVGEVLASTIAYFLSVPLYRTSHQEGHIAAGEYTLTEQLPSPFIAVHLSGGTSEIVLAKRTSGGYEIKRLGGTLDLAAGQLVDRVGVRLGFPFPSGPHLEQAALNWAQNHRDSSDFPVIPSFVKECNFSFSGPATAALKLISQEQYSPGQIARAVEHVLVKTLEKSLRFAVQAYQCQHVLLVGGVTANRYIRRKLKEKLEHRAVGARLYFADVKYATDNAFGVACLTMRWLYDQQS
jgi:N6-L-threonylcarbamoyladenine synthase